MIGSTGGTMKNNIYFGMNIRDSRSRKQVGGGMVRTDPDSLALRRDYSVLVSRLVAFLFISSFIFSACAFYLTYISLPSGLVTETNTFAVWLNSRVGVLMSGILLLTLRPAFFIAGKLVRMRLNSSAFLISSGVVLFIFSLFDFLSDLHTYLWLTQVVGWH